MIFNGEIYNYIELRGELVRLGVVFHTATDSEVLLAAWVHWGLKSLSRLDGMFAFVIYDKVNQTLHCINDPFGIKPFYYSLEGKSFHFGSEIPALLELVCESVSLDVQSAASFLLWGKHDQGSETFISGIRRLEPGHFIEYSLDQCRISQVSRWWKPDLNLDRSLSFDDAAEALRTIFLSSVQRQLRSDVPVGFALSGGVDSSAIVCATRHLDPYYPIRTFSYVASREPLNEQKWAKIVNSHVGAKAHYIHDSDDDFDLDAAMLSQGEPFGSTSILAGLHVFKRMKKEGVVVSLDGQGADESLAGYDGYPQAVIRDLLSQGGYSKAARFLNAWSKWPGRDRSAVLKVLGDMFVPNSLRRRAIHLLGYDTTPSWLDTKVLKNLGVSLSVPSALPMLPEYKGRRLAERLRIAMTDVGLPRLLRYADRNSMHFSIESRVPFLSPALVEFMLKMPTEYLVSSEGQSKFLFREAMKGIVPEAILNRRDKIGFQTPEIDLLIANRALVHEWIQAAEGVPFLKVDEVRKIVDAYLNREIPYQSRCWRLVNFCRWHALTGIST